MVERGNGKEPKQNQESILTRDMIEFILEGARENLSAHGSLLATLFMRLDNGERTITPLSLPRTPVEKQVYFTLLGLSIRKTGREIHEAVMVSEAWYVAPNKDEQTDIAPSKHPDRKEAINLVGRDALGLRQVFAIQPFQRDKENRPVFESFELHNLDEDEDQNFYSTSLLDHLFPPDNLVLH